MHGFQRRTSIPLHLCSCSRSAKTFDTWSIVWLSGWKPLLGVASFFQLTLAGASEPSEVTTTTTVTMLFLLRILSSPMILSVQFSASSCVVMSASLIRVSIFLLTHLLLKDDRLASTVMPWSNSSVFTLLDFFNPFIVFICIVDCDDKFLRGLS